MPFHITPFAAVAMVVFVVFSVLVGAFMAGAGGWRALADRYRAGPMLPNGGDEERFRFASLRTAGGAIGLATYESCVTIGVGERGISLALLAPFRLWHPPLFIPWEAVEGCRRMEHTVGPLTELRVREGGTLTFVGKPGAAIASRVECGGR